MKIEIKAKDVVYGGIVLLLLCTVLYLGSTIYNTQLKTCPVVEIGYAGFTDTDKNFLIGIADIQVKATDPCYRAGLVSSFDIFELNGKIAGRPICIQASE